MRRAGLSVHDTHHKRFSTPEREETKFSFLRAPNTSNQTVPHNHLFPILIEARVEMKGYISAFTDGNGESNGKPLYLNKNWDTRTLDLNAQNGIGP